MKGQLAQIARARDSDRLVVTYARAQRVFTFLSRWQIVAFDSNAAAVFERLKRQRHGIGTMDLRIASIAIATGATLLSRNLRDFQLVPDLKVEDWLS